MKQVIGTLRVVDHVALVAVDGDHDVIADPVQVALRWNTHPALMKAVEAAENSLEYIVRAHPEITGRNQRYEALELIYAALKLVREAHP